MEARRQAEPEYARAERDRAQVKVLGSFMTYGSREQAQKLAVKLGLAPEETLLRLAWMGEREASGGTTSQRTWFFYAFESKVRAARDSEAAARHEYLTTDGVRWKFSTPVRREPGGSAWTAPAQWPPMPQPAASASSQGRRLQGVRRTSAGRGCGNRTSG